MKTTPSILVVEKPFDPRPGVLQPLDDAAAPGSVEIDVHGPFRRAVARVARVVRLDLRLAGRDGAEVFRWVREANPAAPVVLITGYRDDIGRVFRRLLADAVDSVTKRPSTSPGFSRNWATRAGEPGAGDRPGGHSPGNRAVERPTRAGPPTGIQSI
jgi:CheY-like chemotaxis protein